jgi:PKD repeat protein
MKSKLLIILILFANAKICFGKVFDIDAHITYTSCHSAQVNLYAVIDSMYGDEQFCWDVGRGYLSCETNENYQYVSYTTSGTYSVTLKYIRNGDTTIITKLNYLTLWAAPKADFLFTSNDTSQYHYPPASFSFLNKSQKGDGDTLKYSWSIDSNVYSTDTNMNYTFQNPGIHYIKLDVQDNYGCTANISKRVFIQTPEMPYVPFPTKNAMWTEMSYNAYADTYSKFHCYAIKDNDTMINGKLYSKLYHSFDTTFTEDKLCGAIREENKKIYYYSIKKVNILLDSMKQELELILFDFSLKLGDSINDLDYWLSDPGILATGIVDSVKINGEYRRRLTFGHPGFTPFSIYTFVQWVEGIGYLRGLLTRTGIYPFGIYADLICFWQDGKLLYHNSDYQQCFYIQDTTAIGVLNRAKDEISIFPNPVTKTASIKTTGEVFKSFKIYNATGIEIRSFSIKKQVDFSFSVEGFAPGIYIGVLRGTDVPCRTVKFTVQ